MPECPARDIERGKQALRGRLWCRLVDGATDDSYGKIPGLYGADAAAARLAELGHWKRAAIPVTEDQKGEQS